MNASSTHDQDARARRALFAIVFLSLAVRLGAVFTNNFGQGPGPDEDEHYGCALALVEGHGYAMVPQQATVFVLEPTAYRMPGPALVMALFMLVFGTSMTVARIAAVLASTASVPLLYLFARRAGPPRAALAAALACALYPTWVVNGSTLQSEPFFVPALLGALLLSVRAVERRTAASVAWAGLAWGATTLVKPLALPMALLFGLYLAWTLGRRRLPSLAALPLCYALVLAPWVARNAVVLHHFVPLATEGGETFLGANNPHVVEEEEHHGLWLSPMQLPEYSAALESVHDDVERSRVLTALGARYLTAHPEVIPALVLHKWQRLLTPVTRSRGLGRWAVLGSYGALLLLLTVGFARQAVPSTPALHLAGLWVLTMLVVTAVYWGNLTRGRVVIEVVLLPWAATSLLSLLDRWRTSRRAAASVTAC